MASQHPYSSGDNLQLDFLADSPISDRDMNIERLEKENSQLKEEHDAQFQSNKVLVAALQDEIQELKETIKDMKKTHSNVRDVTNKLTKRVTKLEEDNATLEEDYATLGEEHDDLEDQFKSLKTHFEDNQSKLIDADEENAEAQVEYIKLEEEIVELKAQLETSNSQAHQQPAAPALTPELEESIRNYEQHRENFGNYINHIAFFDDCVENNDQINHFLAHKEEFQEYLDNQSSFKDYVANRDSLEFHVDSRLEFGEYITKHRDFDTFLATENDAQVELSRLQALVDTAKVELETKISESDTWKSLYGESENKIVQLRHDAQVEILRIQAQTDTAKVELENKTSESTHWKSLYDTSENNIVQLRHDAQVEVSKIQAQADSSKVELENKTSESTHWKSLYDTSENTIVQLHQNLNEARLAAEKAASDMGTNYSANTTPDPVTFADASTQVDFPAEAPPSTSNTASIMQSTLEAAIAQLRGELQIAKDSFFNKDREAAALNSQLLSIALTDSQTSFLDGSQRQYVSWSANTIASVKKQQLASEAKYERLRKESLRRIQNLKDEIANEIANRDKLVSCDSSSINHKTAIKSGMNTADMSPRRNRPPRVMGSRVQGLSSKKGTEEKIKSKNLVSVLEQEVSAIKIKALTAELEQKAKLLAERDERNGNLEREFRQLKSDKGRNEDEIHALKEEVKRHQDHVFYRHEGTVNSARTLQKIAVQEKEAALQALRDYKLLTEHDRVRIETYDRMFDNFGTAVVKAAKDCELLGRVNGRREQSCLSYISESSKEIITLRQSEKGLKSTTENLNRIITGMKQAEGKADVDADRKLTQIREDAAFTRNLLKNRGQEMKVLEDAAVSKESQIRLLTAELEVAKKQNELLSKNKKADSELIMRLQGENMEIIQRFTDLEALVKANSTASQTGVESKTLARIGKLELENARMAAELKALKEPANLPTKPKRLRKRDMKNGPKQDHDSVGGDDVTPQLNPRVKMVLFFLLCLFMFLSLCIYANWSLIFSDEHIKVLGRTYYMVRFLFIFWTSSDKTAASLSYYEYIMAGGSDLSWLVHR